MQLVNHFIFEVVALKKTRCIRSIDNGLDALTEPVINIASHQMNIMIGVSQVLFPMNAWWHGRLYG